MVFTIIVGSLILVFLISSVLWKQVENENKDYRDLTPPKGFKYSRIKELPIEWNHREKSVVITIHNFILIGEGIEKYKIYRENYFKEIPNGLQNDCIWSFLQFIKLENVNNKEIFDKINEEIKLFRLGEKMEKEELKEKKRLEKLNKQPKSNQ